MPDSVPANSSARYVSFPPTRWSVVLAASDTMSGASDEALEELCRTYWFPLYAYVRRRGHTKQDAEDLTQEFFRQLLERHWIADADREKGRLRSFLLTAMKHFLAKDWRRISARKRGGDKTHVPIDTTFAESHYGSDPNSGLSAGSVFDRQWALTLLNLTMVRLEDEYERAGKSAEHAVLKDSLMAARGTIDYPALTEKLGTSIGAVRVAVHRMRKRFRELYRQEVWQTLSPGANLEEEIRHLAESLVDGQS